MEPPANAPNAPNAPQKEKGVVMVEAPDTIIELVDLYVPPPPQQPAPNQVIYVTDPTMTQPLQQVQLLPLHHQLHNPGTGFLLQQQLPGQLWCQVGQAPSLIYTEAPTVKPPEPPPDHLPTRGRKRGRKPSVNKVTKPRAKRPRKPPSPPPRPLPPVPDYFKDIINPLENEIIPRVIVQDAHIPWKLPRDLTDVQPAPPTPDRLDPEEANAVLRQSHRLFGPGVSVTKLVGGDPEASPTFLAARRNPNGQQERIVFTAEQLYAFRSQYPTKFNWKEPVTQSQSYIALTCDERMPLVPVQKAPVFKMSAPRVPFPTPPASLHEFVPPPVISINPMLHLGRVDSGHYNTPITEAGRLKEEATLQANMAVVAAAAAQAAQAEAVSAVTPQQPRPPSPKAASPPPADRMFGDFVMPASVGPALPSILKHKSQMKLKNTMERHRARARAAQEAAEAEAAEKERLRERALELERQRNTDLEWQRLREAELQAQDPQASVQTFMNALLLRPVHRGKLDSTNANLNWTPPKNYSFKPNK